jgi:uncharacterized protein (DUF1778 family)
MKSVTEFANLTLKKALATKAALVAEGKSAEEIVAGLGEAFKYEGEKLKHFTNALDVAVQHNDNLKRVLVMTFAETETAPANATKVDEHHYVPEMHTVKNYDAKKPEAKDGRGKGGGGKR